MDKTVPLGRVLITPGALSALSAASIRDALGRHEKGDWGEVDTEDARANDWSLAHGARLLSSYRDREMRFWIITEADRSATTILLPEEY
jgi:hypothetical protein